MGAREEDTTFAECQLFIQLEEEGQEVPLGAWHCQRTVSTWSCKQVAQWLQEEGSEYVELLCTQHRLDGLSLLALTEADPWVPLGLTVLGDIKRLTFSPSASPRDRIQAQLEELGLRLRDTFPFPLGSSPGARGRGSCDGATGRYNGGDRCVTGLSAAEERVIDLTRFERRCVIYTPTGDVGTWLVD
ncbi:sphingomyelin synthase-related protein 1-like protein [Lates japonicus]|uniref:Sphingomyelin synthase-related protein 1-like protein n=1 Tax=Lates japonicus TaxID=270547 RepID=A0AAD3RFA2_LATJO|nr:sphingomyelin synthase-related protein 1-like protein [Lates japonicus]